MLDPYNRHITYLRISVTDRCNLRCMYCMPKGQVTFMPREHLLSPDEIAEVVKVAARLGIKKIRLTGGEPLVRHDIVEIVRRIRAIEGITEICLTTNGTRLAQLAFKLKEAGLSRVNISLDTLNPEKFTMITRGRLTNVLDGIEAALAAQLTPVKINFVRIKGVNETDEEEVKKFCAQKNLQVRFIRQMNLRTGEFYPVEGGDGGNCQICNRLRLTARGDIKPCLFGSSGFNIRELGIEQAFMMAIRHKPAKGEINDSHSFYNIGG
ncbi:MAG: GTP 3',8-cyclase MoaA [Bacteroidales bacterium]|nr:GTP 3',8-cyclase MoaA [Bacteroidales bacterium]HPO66593.1 GTP 3',8-cyclase MoaA [Bacteroidales bacterium]